jgi:hypothetical protein
MFPYLNEGRIWHFPSGLRRKTSVLKVGVRTPIMAQPRELMEMHLMNFERESR